MSETLDTVLEALGRYRFNYTDEAELQQAIADALTLAGLEPEREIRLDRRNRIDLLVDRVGIEVKVDGRSDSVMRQLQRYATSPLVGEIVLVTNRLRHRPPEQLAGKPVHVHQLMR